MEKPLDWQDPAHLQALHALLGEPLHTGFLGDEEKRKEREQKAFLPHWPLLLWKVLSSHGRAETDQEDLGSC